MKKRANDMAEQPMKVLVVSDVHGRVTPLRWLLKNETADALFFLGDGLYDLDQAIAANGAAPDYPIYRVRGNCDIGSDDPAEGLAPFGGVLFFYTHGHLFGVKSGYERIAEYAADRGADVVLFGHTHYNAAPRYAVFPGTVQPRQPAGYPQLWRDHHHRWTVQF